MSASISSAMVSSPSSDLDKCLDNLQDEWSTRFTRIEALLTMKPKTGESSATSSSDNPWTGGRPQPVGNVSVAFPAEEWLCKKFEDMNHTTLSRYQSPWKVEVFRLTSS